MKFSLAEKILVALAVVLAVMTGASFFLQDIKILFAGYKVVAPSISLSAADISVTKYVPPQKLSNPPAIIKAVYVTGYSAGSKKYLNYLSNLFKTTEINAAVVDIKDYSGLVSYKSGAPDAQKI